MVLDIILHPFFENTIYAIEQDRPLYWCIVSLLKNWMNILVILERKSKGYIREVF